MVSNTGSVKWKMFSFRPNYLINCERARRDIWRERNGISRSSGGLATSPTCQSSFIDNNPIIPEYQWSKKRHRYHTPAVVCGYLPRGCGLKRGGGRHVIAGSLRGHQGSLVRGVMWEAALTPWANTSHIEAMEMPLISDVCMSFCLVNAE